MEFPQKAQKLLRRVDDKYKGGGRSVVDLVSDIVGRGSHASKELQELKVLVDDLLGLQAEFVQTYDKSCNRSMEQFMLMVTDLSHTQVMITSLKQKVLRLRGSMGSHAGDLISFYKKKQRNIYLLQLLKAVKSIATMESKSFELLKQGQYYQSSNLFAACQILFEQWPHSQEAKHSRSDLDTIYTRLVMLLSKEKVSSHCAAVESVLVDNVLRRSRLADQRVFAAIMEENELPADSTPRVVNFRIAIKTTNNMELEQVPLYEGVQVFADDMPLVSCLPYELLNGIILRTLYVLPPHMSTSFTATVRSVAYVAFKGSYADEEGELGLWMPVNLPFSTVGDSAHHGHEGLEQKWVFYKQAVEAKAHCTYPCSAEGLPMMMIIVPEIADPAEKQRAECLSALHLLGNVGTPKPNEDQRLLDIVGRILQAASVTQHHVAYIEDFVKAFNTWRSQHVMQEGSVILSGLRDMPFIKSADSSSDGAIGSLDSFAYERKMASAQQPLLHRFIKALTNELLEVLRNYVDMIKKTFERCYPCYVDGKWEMAQCTLGERELVSIAKDLLACTESAPEQEHDSMPAMGVARRAAALLTGGKPWGLEYLVGPRKVEGWLGMSTISSTHAELQRGDLEENMGLDLDPGLRLLKVRAGSPAHVAGLSKFTGYKLVSVKIPGHQERICIDTLNEYNEVIRCQKVVMTYFEREVPPPRVGLQVVNAHIEATCREAGDECSDEHITSAVAALLEKVKESVKEIILRSVGKCMSSLEECWETLQIKMCPVLEALCKETAVKGGVTRRKENSSPKNDNYNLEKLLESRFGADKLPRLLEGTQHVAFSFRAMSEPTTAKEEKQPILQHFMATPFNTVFLYRAVVQFTSNASRLIYNRPQGTTNILQRSLELLVLNELLPKVKTYYSKKIDEAMESASPTHMDDAGCDEVPVLEPFLIAGHALQTFAELQEAIPVSNAGRTIRSYVEDVLKKVLARSLQHLGDKTAGTSCGELGMPIVTKILQSLDEEDDFKAESIVGIHKHIWKTMSAAQDPQVTSNALSYLEQHQGRSGSRVHGILEKSVDISYLMCLVHSLEWLADQVMLHWGQGGRSEFTMSEKIFRAKTACYNTVVPGVEYDEDLEMEEHREEAPEEDGPWVSVEHPQERASPAIDNLWRKLIALSRGAFFTLIFDLFTRTFTLLDSRDASYDQEYDTLQPDEMVAVFTQDARRMYVTYTHYLPPLKQQYLMQALPTAASNYLIKNIGNMRQKYVTTAGVARLQRNVFSLQQSLALMVTEVTISDFQLERVKSYYDLLLMRYEELLENREKLVGDQFSDQEYEAALAVVYTAWSRQGGTA